MKSYKIMENRTELTKEQVAAGMNFGKIKSKAASGNKWKLKKIIGGSALIIMAVAGAYFLNRHQPQDVINPVHDVISPKHGTSVPNIDSGVTRQNTTELSEPKVEIGNSRVHAIKKKESQVESSLVKTHEEKPEEKRDSAIAEKNNMVKADTSSASSDAKESAAKPRYSIPADAKYICRILKPGTFCNVSKEVNMPVSIHCDNCNFSYRGCTELGETKNGVAVWLSIPINKRMGVTVKNHLANMSLVVPDSDSLTPATGIYFFSGGEHEKKPYQYTTVDVKTAKLTAYFFKRIDIVIVFPDAHKGDRIRIDNLINAVIQE